MGSSCDWIDLSALAGCGKSVGQFGLPGNGRAGGLLAAARLEPKRMQLLAYDRRKPPYAVLVEAVKDGGPGLEVLPVHYQMEP